MKARNPGNTVEAMNPVFNLLIQKILKTYGDFWIKLNKWLKHFHFLRSFRSFEGVRAHKKVKHCICCCFCVPWVPSFRLICIKP